MKVDTLVVVDRSTGSSGRVGDSTQLLKFEDSFDRTNDTAEIVVVSTVKS